MHCLLSELPPIEYVPWRKSTPGVFVVEVVINALGLRVLGKPCNTKKDAEQTAAKGACEALRARFDAEKDTGRQEAASDWSTVVRRGKQSGKEEKTPLTSLFVNLREAYQQEGEALLERMGVQDTARRREGPEPSLGADAESSTSTATRQ